MANLTIITAKATKINAFCFYFYTYIISSSTLSIFVDKIFLQNYKF